MAQYLCPFSISDIRQIPSSIVKEYNLGLEAIILDGSQLKDIVVLKEQINIVQKQFPGRLKSVHFPTENANYSGDKDIFNALLKLIDVCIDCSVSKIIIHSNYFQSLEQFDPIKLPSIRPMFEKLFAEMNTYIGDRACTLLIENIPVIGNLGDDFDSVFVFPEDFSCIRKFSNMGVVWDLGHWALTVAALNLKDRVIPATRKHADFWEFKKILPEIKHLHVSSFTGIPDKQTGIVCKEGTPMHRGDFKEESFKEALQLITTTNPNILLSLEIAESDYMSRSNLAETLVWLRKNDLF
ncbi:MAG TPA: hypothetical protein VJH63_02615 [Candidatus Paceibacterota bacterium]